MRKLVIAVFACAVPALASPMQPRPAVVNREAQHVTVRSDPGAASHQRADQASKATKHTETRRLKDQPNDASMRAPWAGATDI